MAFLREIALSNTSCLQLIFLRSHRLILQWAIYCSTIPSNAVLVHISKIPSTITPQKVVISVLGSPQQGVVHNAPCDRPCGMAA
jgi:hypothetical protein